LSNELYYGLTETFCSQYSKKETKRIFVLKYKTQIISRLAESKKI